MEDGLPGPCRPQFHSRPKHHKTEIRARSPVQPITAATRQRRNQKRRFDFESDLWICEVMNNPTKIPSCAPSRTQGAFLGNTSSRASATRRESLNVCWRCSIEMMSSTRLIGCIDARCCGWSIDTCCYLVTDLVLGRSTAACLPISIALECRRPCLPSPAADSPDGATK